MHVCTDEESLPVALKRVYAYNFHFILHLSYLHLSTRWIYYLIFREKIESFCLVAMIQMMDFAA